jgi:hypothetical protein
LKCAVVKQIIGTAESLEVDETKRGTLRKWLWIGLDKCFHPDCDPEDAAEELFSGLRVLVRLMHLGNEPSAVLLDMADDALDGLVAGLAEMGW